MLATRVEVPLGLRVPYQMVWIPLEATLALLVVTAVPFILFHHPWLLGVALPTWSVFRWQAARDPLFLRVWLGQLTYKRYYLHG